MTDWEGRERGSVSQSQPVLASNGQPEAEPSDAQRSAGSERFTMRIMERDAKGRRVPGVTFSWPPTAAHRRRADDNHGQTLERLEARGGLCWTELYCILRDAKLSSVAHSADNQIKARQWANHLFPAESNSSSPNEVSASALPPDEHAILNSSIPKSAGKESAP